MNFVSEGRKHDAGMLAESHLLDDLHQYAFSLAGQPLCIYGDLAYPTPVHHQCPFRNGVLTPQMEAYNTAMSSVRTSVEWLVKTLSYSLNSTFTSRFTRTITAKRKIQN